MSSGGLELAPDAAHGDSATKNLPVSCVAISILGVVDPNSATFGSGCCDSLKSSCPLRDSVISGVRRESVTLDVSTLGLQEIGLLCV